MGFPPQMTAYISFLRLKGLKWRIPIQSFTFIGFNTKFLLKVNYNAYPVDCSSLTIVRKCRCNKVIIESKNCAIVSVRGPMCPTPILRCPVNINADAQSITTSNDNVQSLHTSSMENTLPTSSVTSSVSESSTSNNVRGNNKSNVSSGSSKVLMAKNANSDALLPHQECSRLLNIREQHVVYISDQVLKHNATIPFLARYRKDHTGGLDEVTLQRVVDTLEELTSVAKRRVNMLKSLFERGELSVKLKTSLDQCITLTTLEDLYQPYREERGSLAEKARVAGLGPLADEMLYSITTGDKEISNTDKNNLNRLRGINSPSEVILNKRLQNLTSDVGVDADRLLLALLTEKMHKCNAGRTVANKLLRALGSLTATLDESRRKTKKMSDEEWSVLAKHYNFYHSYSVKLSNVTGTATLGIQRGCANGILKSNISYPEEVPRKIAEAMLPNYPGLWRLKHSTNLAASYLKRALKDAISQHIVKSTLTSIRRDLKQLAEKESLLYFSYNLRRLVLQRPMPVPVLAMDPGYKFGIKCVILDELMNLRGKFVIHLHEKDKFCEVLQKLCGDDNPVPSEGEGTAVESKMTTQKSFCIKKIVIGNGTACRETEEMVSDAIQKLQRTDIEYAIVSESGASVYSASAIAAEEFPQLNIMYRGSISIGRRVQDPISEMVKIPVRSIGVGLYQHDIPEKLLLTELRNTAQSCVSFVGVNVETASKYLLQAVPGLNPRVADAIYHNRRLIKRREDLLKVPGMNQKMYQLVAGFLRVMNSSEPLDRTNIHPESYEATRALCKRFQFTAESLGDPQQRQKIYETIIKALDEETKKGVDQFIKENPLPRTDSSGLNVDSGIHNGPGGLDLMACDGEVMKEGMCDTTAPTTLSVDSDEYDGDSQTPLTMERIVQMTAAATKARNALLQRLADECHQCGKETIQQIISTLGKSTLDPRTTLQHSGVFKRSIRRYSDLKDGDIITGIVVNVTPFGAFVDIGTEVTTLISCRSFEHQFSLQLNSGDILDGLVVQEVSKGQGTIRNKGTDKTGASTEESKVKEFILKLDRINIRNSQEFASFDESRSFRGALSAVQRQRKEIFPQLSK